MTTENQKESIYFFPSVWKQRLRLAYILFENSRCSAVVDAGCGSGKALEAFLHIKHLTRMAGLDIDFGHLAAARKTLQYLSQPVARTTPLTIDLFEGSVLMRPPREWQAKQHLGLAFLEVIEHLQPREATLAGVALLHQLRPRIAIISTPNADFNSLFADDGQGKKEFRNSDHKFEWSREEFHSWIDQSLKKLDTEGTDNYAVVYVGLGEPPSQLPLGMKQSMKAKTQLSQSQKFLFLRWFSDDEDPKFFHILPPDQQKGCNRIEDSRGDADLEDHGETSIASLRTELLKTELFKRDAHRHEPKLLMQTPSGCLFGIPVFQYMCFTKEEYDMYITYGPCTQAAIVFDKRQFRQEEAFLTVFTDVNHSCRPVDHLPCVEPALEPVVSGFWEKRWSIDLPFCAKLSDVQLPRVIDNRTEDSSRFVPDPIRRRRKRARSKSLTFRFPNVNSHARRNIL